MPISEGGRFTPNDRIVSPGVFSRENDLSGIAQGVADIGAVVVAPFPKGPGFAPTVVNSVSELESKFGIADGTYYGPYTAAEYLKEKGFVTVCRVGALTGYHQKYPYVIYAEKGTWGRSNDGGWFDSGSTYLVSTAIAYNTMTGSGAWGTESATNYSGSIIFSASFSPTFASVSGFGSVSDATQGTGSVLYYGQTVPVGNFSANIYIETRLTASLTTSASILTHLLGSGSVVGGLTSSAIVGGSYPWDTALTLTSPYVSQSFGECNDVVYHIQGLLGGEFGNYDGTFDPDGTLTYDPCSGSWDATSGTPDYKIIAVLADTQNATINSSLESPGFNGSSSMATASAFSGAVELDYNLSLYPTDSSTSYGTYKFSFDPNSTKYIANVFDTDPTVGDPDYYVTGTKKESAYLYKFFENSLKKVVADKVNWRFVGAALPSGSMFVGEPLKFVDDYSLDLLNGDSNFSLTNAYTPWVISQQMATWGDSATAIRHPLFKIHTLTDGTNANTSFKIEISNIKLAGQVAGSDWGSFTLTLRSYSDTDRKPKIIEMFANLSLDPDSVNYIARRIGDRYNFIRYDGKIIEFGDYDNLSKHIRIEMSSNPLPVAAVPYGFQAYALPVNSAAGYWCEPIKYSKASVYGLFPGKYPSGVVFDDAPTGADAELSALYPTASTGIGVSIDNKQYFAPLPEFESYSSVGRNEVFALDNAIVSGGVITGSFLSGSNAVPAIYDASNESTHVKMRKFVFGFQGGFDGQSPSIPINIGSNISSGNTQGLNCATSTDAGSIAYKQCFGALGNADEFDMNLISTPGIIYSLHSYVTNLVVDVCETRGDCFYIADLYLDNGNPTSGQIDEVVSLAAEFDTNYAGTYYPWLKIKNIYTNKIEMVPPSVILPAIYANNDRVAGEWYAVGGLTRGGIPQAVQVSDRTTHTERDTLYEGRVNPIAAFPGQGISVWGQKTLQVAASALDRINVRRLLIEIKKFFASTSKYLVFEQNTAQTRNKFLAIVNPYLESIQQRSGLYAFQVVMDDSNNTPDLIDRNILYGQIWLKPTKTAEFIILDFNVLPTGASFPTA
jgi:hypothetical protein